MKKSAFILTTLLTCALCFGQVQYINVGTNADDHTGELIGHNTWVKLNYDFAFLDAGQSNLNLAVGAATNLPLNLVYSSTLVPLLVSNSYPFTGSNFLGWFTNVYSFVSSSPSSIGNGRFC